MTGRERPWLGPKVTMNGARRKQEGGGKLGVALDAEGALWKARSPWTLRVRR